MNSTGEIHSSDTCKYVDLYSIVDGRVKPKQDVEEKRVRHEITRRPTTNRRVQRPVHAVQLPSTSSNGERSKKITPPVKQPAHSRTMGRASTPNIPTKATKACGTTSIPIEVFVAKQKRLQNGSLHSDQKHHNKLHDGQERREERTHLSTSRRRSLDSGQPSREQGSSHSSSRRHSECQSRRSVDSRGSSDKVGHNSSHSGRRRHSACQSHRPAAEPRASADSLGHHSSQSPSAHCVPRRVSILADQSPTNKDESQQSPSGGTRLCRAVLHRVLLRDQSCRSMNKRVTTLVKHQTSRSLVGDKEIRTPKPPQVVGNPTSCNKRVATLSKQQSSRSLDDDEGIRMPKPSQVVGNLTRCNKRVATLSKQQSSRSLDDDEEIRTPKPSQIVENLTRCNKRGNKISKHQPSRSLYEEIRTPKPSQVVGNPTSCNGFSLGRYF
jgi:hypothetical protein